MPLGCSQDAQTGPERFASVGNRALLRRKGKEVSIQEQIEFMQELEKRFLDLDRYYTKEMADYDAEYEDAAQAAGEIIESLWRLQELEH